MPTARYHCPEFADAIERLVEDESTGLEGSPYDRLFQFIRVDEGPETVETALDLPTHQNGVTLQTVSTLQADGEIRGDGQSSGTGHGGGRSGPDEAVPGGDGMDGTRSSQSLTTTTGGGDR